MDKYEFKNCDYCGKDSMCWMGVFPEGYGQWICKECLREIIEQIEEKELKRQIKQKKLEETEFDLN